MACNNSTTLHIQILSLAIFAGGAWLLYVGEENDYDVITGSSIVSGAALLVLAGGVALVVSAVGMVGAFGMWRPILIIVSDIILIVYSETTLIHGQAESITGCPDFRG